MTLAPHQDPALDGTTPLRVGVVAPRRRLAWVRVLHEALARHHPAATLTALVLDGVLGRRAVRAGCARRRARRRGALASPRDDARPCGGVGTRTWLRRSRAISSRPAIRCCCSADDVLVRGPSTISRACARTRGGAGAAPDSPLPEDGRRPDAADMARLGAYDDAIVGVPSDGEAFARLVGASQRPRAGSTGARSAPLSMSRRRVPPRARRRSCARLALAGTSTMPSARRRAPARCDSPTSIPASPICSPRSPGEAPRVLLSEHPDLALICRDHAEPRAAGQRCDRVGCLMASIVSRVAWSATTSCVRFTARRSCSAPVVAIQSHPIRTTRPRPMRFARGWRSLLCARPMASRSVATCTRSTAVAATYRACFPICGRRQDRSSSGPTATGAASSTSPPRCCRRAAPSRHAATHRGAP